MFLITSNSKSRRSLIEFVKDRPGHDKRYAIDASKLENELGWRAEENFDTGIVKTIKWYLENKQPVPRNHFGKHKWFS